MVITSICFALSLIVGVVAVYVLSRIKKIIIRVKEISTAGERDFISKGVYIYCIIAFLLFLITEISTLLEAKYFSFFHTFCYVHIAICALILIITGLYFRKIAIKCYKEKPKTYRLHINDWYSIIGIDVMCIVTIMNTICMCFIFICNVFNIVI